MDGTAQPAHPREPVADDAAGLSYKRAAGVSSQAFDIEEEVIADMVSYRKNVTGLDNTIFISVKFAQHAPRIKVAIDPPTHIDPFGNNASVSIRDGNVVAGKLPAHVGESVRDFIALNREVLLDYWEKRIDTDELRRRLQSI